MRRIFRALFSARTDEEVTENIDLLNITLEAEREAAEKHEREQHRRNGTATLLPAGTAKRIADDWNASIIAARDEE